MLRLAKAIPTHTRWLSVQAPRMDVFKELKDFSNEPSKSSTTFDIDDLIERSPKMYDSGESGDFSFGSAVPHPRDVAKLMSSLGPQSGRVVDVRNGDVGGALKQLLRLLASNKVYALKKQQARHLRPALLHEQKHRNWWRRNFRNKFSVLMADINTAKRRGY